MSKEEKLGASAADNALAANLRLGVWILRSPVRAQEVCWPTAIPALRSQAGCLGELEYMNFRSNERSSYLKQNIENGGGRDPVSTWDLHTFRGHIYTHTHSNMQAMCILHAIHVHKLIFKCL